MKWFFPVTLAFLLSGCVAVDQEWVHAKKPAKQGVNYHRLVPGHIRWYQFNDGWFNLGGKPPAGLGGIIYTVWHPSDWFWYGPYEKDVKKEFKDYWKKDCEGCKASFEYVLKAVNEKQAELNKIEKTEDNLLQIMSLETQIMNLDNNNCLGGDFTTPFEERFK